MPLHLYCIVPAGHETAESGPDGSAGEGSGAGDELRSSRAGRPTGIDGAAVRAVAVDAFACLVSEHPSRPPAATANVRVHNAVIVAAMDRRVTPVPLRFGQCLDDEAAIRRELESDAARWTRLLADFAGHAEFGVRVSAAADGPGSAANGPGSAADGPGSAADESGTAAGAARDLHTVTANPGRLYMAALARRQQAASRHRDAAGRIASEIARRAGGLVTDSRMQPLDRRDGLLSIAHMVAWTHVDEYHACMQELRTEMKDLQLLCTGPWPPYSFVA
ncbi:hypothetical protein BH23GEM9_BH23GEM9_00900 [soil metagenome]